MTIKFSIAKKTERYWWLRDDKGLIHKLYLSIYRCEKEGIGFVIYGIILGPLHWRVCVNK